MISPKYDSVSDRFESKESLVRISEDKKMGVLNSDGIEIVPCEYRLIYFLKSRYIIVQDFRYQFALIDIYTKKEVIPFGKYRLEPRGEYLLASGNGGKGIIDINENIIVPFKYTWIDGGKDCILRVIKNGTLSSQKWGIIDLKGNEVLPAIYDRINSFKDGSKYGYAYLENKCIRIDLDELRGLKVKTQDISSQRINKITHSRDDVFYDEDYREWSGGWSREDVDSELADAFDDDLDALWNID